MNKQEEIDAQVALLRDALSFDQAILALAKYMVFVRKLRNEMPEFLAFVDLQISQVSNALDVVGEQWNQTWDLAETGVEAVAHIRESNTLRAKKAADSLHNKPGGNRAKQESIRDIWASGKYSSRDVCAEQECAALGMSFSTARKALRNTPSPS